MSRTVTTAIAGLEVLEDAIGSDLLATLTTADKSSLVNAINEVRAAVVAIDPDASGGIEADEVAVGGGGSLFPDGDLAAALAAAEAAIVPYVGGAASVNNAASPYALAAGVRIVLVDLSGGNVEIDLPAGETSRELLVVGLNGPGQITIDPDAAESLDGGAAGDPKVLDVTGSPNLIPAWLFKAVGGGAWYGIDFGAQALAQAQIASGAALNTATTNAGLVDGSTAGNVQTGNACDYRIGGELFTKAATDDLWDLSGETDTDGASYRAYSLELDDSGVASFQAGPNAATEDDALGTLNPWPSEGRIGVFVAAPNCDFDDAGGLAAQGAYFNGNPIN